MALNKWNIQDIEKAFYRHSGNLSVVLRQLIFSEGAAAWLLLTFYERITIPWSFIILYATLFIFILLDLAQYWYLSNKYGELSEKMVSEKRSDIPRQDFKFKYQEVFFNAKKIVAIISIMLFVVFLVSITHMCSINAVIAD